MSEDGDSLSSFMQSQVEEKPSGKDSNANKSSAQNVLDKMKQEEEEEKKKEQDDAKKESKANAAKYAALQANMAKMQAKRLMIIIPVIVIGIMILLILITHGGEWLQGGMQFLVGKVRGE